MKNIKHLIISAMAILGAFGICVWYWADQKYFIAHDVGDYAAYVAICSIFLLTAAIICLHKPMKNKNVNKGIRALVYILSAAIIAFGTFFVTFPMKNEIIAEEKRAEQLKIDEEYAEKYEMLDFINDTKLNFTASEIDLDNLTDEQRTDYSAGLEVIDSNIISPEIIVCEANNPEQRSRYPVLLKYIDETGFKSDEIFDVYSFRNTDNDYDLSIFTDNISECNTIIYITMGTEKEYFGYWYDIHTGKTVSDYYVYPVYAQIYNLKNKTISEKIRFAEVGTDATVFSIVNSIDSNKGEKALMEFIQSHIGE